MSLSRRLALMLGSLLLISVIGATATHLLLGQAGASFTRSQGASDRLARVLQLESPSAIIPRFGRAFGA
jgi:hypothetical protein